MLYFYRESIRQQQQKEMTLKRAELDFRFQESSIQYGWRPVTTVKDYYKRQACLANFHRRRRAYDEMRKWWGNILRTQLVNYNKRKASEVRRERAK